MYIKQNYKELNHMCCEHKEVDLSLLEPVLDSYAGVAGSLITILQNTQEIYGYIPIDAVYRISERTGLSPAKILGVATFYSQFRFKAVGKFENTGDRDSGLIRDILDCDASA